SYGEAFFLPSSSGAADEAEAYLSWLAEDSTDAQLGEPTALDVGSGAESVAQSASWTVSDSSGPYLMQVTTVVTIREADDLMSLATVFFYPDHTDVEQLTDDFGLMAASVTSWTIAGGCAVGAGRARRGPPLRAHAMTDNDPAEDVLATLRALRAADPPTHGGRVLSYVYDSGRADL